MYGGEAAVERLARQRRQFMDAGLELFGSVGYRATTVRMLCKEAELIDRYFYRNFTDTEDLLAAVYTEAMDHIEDRVMKAIQASLGTGDVDRIVDAGLDAFFSAVEDSRIARVCWLEVLGVGPRIDELYTRRIQRFADVLLIVGKSLVPVAEYPKDEEFYTGIALIGAISQSAMQWLLSAYSAERKVLVSANARLLKARSRC